MKSFVLICVLVLCVSACAQLMTTKDGVSTTGDAVSSVTDTTSQSSRSSTRATKGNGESENWRYDE